MLAPVQGQRGDGEVQTSTIHQFFPKHKTLNIWKQLRKGEKIAIDTMEKGPKNTYPLI